MSVLLEVKNLKKQFGGLVAVNGVDMRIAEGEVIGLLGPNGSGKTTVMNLISGALTATSGEVLLRGRPVQAMAAHLRAREGISRTFQLVRLAPSLSAGDNIILTLAFGRKPIWGRAARERAEQVLASVGLAGQGGATVQSLNYIDQKRLELARAIAPFPDLLLLDEWLAGLNPTELRTGIELIRSLERTGVTILLVEHIMEAVRELCPRAIVMSAGAVIADGPTAEVLADPQVVAAYLGDFEHA
ncbi:Branched-chain amino acid transport ATP-binding protein LivG (plasmid) [Sinorhizobium sojae CCBAU 05684]|uniref:Branched-chain amino acid transport ATP-binding protein LivG n=1 Tax=Sinorhizobium sojae CCBAU 05684 TaxID=716928 RepID=A0A249PLK8_9HYPH|nr:ABC transporter ATP-binding protein [Sinorhizobium sojae]ASY66823.1 Branched-chain amino acid transport ATP-binding protein LivG [Sinorhizobium sojae CCBAU 05684]